jgi:hypothetical protein
MYDGSFNSLNMDLCKFAASMPNDLDGFVDNQDFLLEWELVKDSYRRCLLSVDSDWFTIFGQPNSKGVNKLISLSKKGISKYYSKQLKVLGSLDNAFRPSDKLILKKILQADEYTSPVSYEQVWNETSHGSKVPGYGRPKTGKDNNLDQQHLLVELTFKNMRIVNFKPWPWSPVMTIHYNKLASKLKDVLGVVKSQTQTRSIMEPMPLYLADLLSKQASAVIKLYGEVNVGRYPDLFQGFRTSIRK